MTLIRFSLDLAIPEEVYNSIPSFDEMGQNSPVDIPEEKERCHRQ